MKQNWVSLFGSLGPQALLHGTKAVSGGTHKNLVMRGLMLVDGSAATLISKSQVSVPEPAQQLQFGVLCTHSQISVHNQNDNGISVELQLHIE